MIQNSGKEITRIYDSKGLSPTLKGKTGGWQKPKIKCVYLAHAEEERWGNRIIDEFGTLGTSNDIGILKESRIRRLTPVECERLQSFPDNWTEGVSDTQRYKQMGNAVTVNVIETIGREVLRR